MRIDAVSLGHRPQDVAADVARTEDAGYDAWLTGEIAHDPLVACAVAAAHSERLQIGTAIAVAFARSPMQLAYAAHDLQAVSHGRFVLGLGSQLRAHIERRFSATWSRPAARMREFVLALREIWSAWEEDRALEFVGEFYRHTLMTPFFVPEPHGHPAPPVWLAAVGPRMTRVAGEVADGLLCHGFTTPRYLAEVTLPTLQEGTRATGRSRAQLEVGLPVLVATGRDEQELAASERQVRSRVAFYRSTPAYRAVLDLHGWGHLHERLHRLSQRGDWDAMTALVDDEVLHAFAVIAAPERVGERIRRRHAGTVDRVSLYTSHRFDDADWWRLVADLKGA